MATEIIQSIIMVYAYSAFWLLTIVLVMSVLPWRLGNISLYTVIAGVLGISTWALTTFNV